MVEDNRKSRAFDGSGDGPGTGPPWMSVDEYQASLRDVPEEVLDTAPEGMPEELWLAAMEVEAARMPDPLKDTPGGRSWPDPCPMASTLTAVTGRSSPWR